jgi:hypothetical protein
MDEGSKPEKNKDGGNGDNQSFSPTDCRAVAMSGQKRKRREVPAPAARDTIF